jgi:hypothetical protein
LLFVGYELPKFSLRQAASRLSERERLPLNLDVFEAKMGHEASM